MAEVKPDRELSEAGFHSKYSYMAGWDDARDMVYKAMSARRGGDEIYDVLFALWDSMGHATRNEKRDAHVQAIES